MVNPSAEYSESRPFKIFVSLLDKWEIGGPLTEVLVYNALKAIEKHVETEAEGSEDVRTSVNRTKKLVFTWVLGENDCEHPLRSCRASGRVETAPQVHHVRDQG